MLFVVSVILCIQLTPLYLVYRPPDWLVALFESRFPTVIFRNNAITDRHVALTIDDAPSSRTLEILDVLDKHAVTATFFVIGNQVEGREDILEEVVRRGHELGNHAWEDEPSVSLTIDELQRQVRQVEGLLLSIYAKVGKSTADLPRYFRPGSGFFTRSMVGMLEGAGYKLALGNIYPHDPQVKYAWLNARHIVSMLRPGGIIICHDRRGWTAPMLDQALPRIKAKNYKVTRLSELMQRA